MRNTQRQTRSPVPMLLLSFVAAMVVTMAVWWKMDLARLDAAIEQARAGLKTLAIGGRLPATPDVATYLTERGRALDAQHLGVRQWLSVSSDAGLPAAPGAAQAGVDPQLFFQQRMHEVQRLLERLATARTLTVPSMLGLPKELPPSDAVPRFLAQVQLVEELADVMFAESGVERIESFKVEDPELLPPPGDHARAFLSRLPVRVRLACSIESLAKILGRLEHVKPLISLESLQASTAADPAIGPRPPAAGPSDSIQRMAGRDVAPHGAGAQGSQALSVGLHGLDLTIELAAVRYLVTAELGEADESDEAVNR